MDTENSNKHGNPSGGYVEPRQDKGSYEPVSLCCGEENAAASGRKEDLSAKFQQARTSSLFITRMAFETNIGRSDFIIRTFLREIFHALSMLSSPSAPGKKDRQLQAITRGELLTFYSRQRIFDFLVKPGFRCICSPLEPKVVNRMQRWVMGNAGGYFNDCSGPFSLHETGWKFLVDLGVELRGEIPRNSVQIPVNEQPSPINTSFRHSQRDIGVLPVPVSTTVHRSQSATTFSPRLPKRIVLDGGSSSAANINGETMGNYTDDSKMHSHRSAATILPRQEEHHLETLTRKNRPTPRSGIEHHHALRPLATRASRWTSSHTTSTTRIIKPRYTKIRIATRNEKGEGGTSDVTRSDKHRSPVSRKCEKQGFPDIDSPVPFETVAGKLRLPRTHVTGHMSDSLNIVSPEPAHDSGKIDALYNSPEEPLFPISLMALRSDSIQRNNQAARKHDTYDVKFTRSTGLSKDEIFRGVNTLADSSAFSAARVVENLTPDSTAFRPKGHEGRVFSSKNIGKSLIVPDLVRQASVVNANTSATVATDSINTLIVNNNSNALLDEGYATRAQTEENTQREEILPSHSIERALGLTAISSCLANQNGLGATLLSRLCTADADGEHFEPIRAPPQDKEGYELTTSPGGTCSSTIVFDESHRSHVTNSSSTPPYVICPTLTKQKVTTTKKKDKRKRKVVCKPEIESKACDEDDNGEESKLDANAAKRPKVDNTSASHGRRRSTRLQTVARY